MLKKAFSKTAILLTAFCLILPFFSFEPLQGSSDYVFKDENGENVVLPKNVPVFLLDSPGIHAPLIPFHAPEIKIKTKKTGLESVRELTLHFPVPPAKGQSDKLIKIYILDKDALVIGYHAFFMQHHTASFRLNGVINYIRLYVQCTHHGLWRKDIKFEKMAKP